MDVQRGKRASVAVVSLRVAKVLRSRGLSVCCSADHGGQPRESIVGELPQAFKLRVAALKLPVVVVRRKRRAGQARDRGFIREDADHIGAALDPGVQSIDRAGRSNESAAGVPSETP